MQHAKSTVFPRPRIIHNQSVWLLKRPVGDDEGGDKRETPKLWPNPPSLSPAPRCAATRSGNGHLSRHFVSRRRTNLTKRCFKIDLSSPLSVESAKT